MLRGLIWCRGGRQHSEGRWMGRSGLSLCRDHAEVGTQGINSGVSSNDNNNNIYLKSNIQCT